MSSAGDKVGGSDAKYDVLVVGSGIGGMESALKLGDMGYKVLLVEKEGSVGGKIDLAVQGLSYLGLRQLHLDAQNGRHHTSPQSDRAHLL